MTITTKQQQETLTGKYKQICNHRDVAVGVEHSRAQHQCSLPSFLQIYAQFCFYLT